MTVVVRLVFAVAAALVAAGCGGPAVVVEDDPGRSCWDQGNGWCGPVAVVLTAGGTTATVNDVNGVVATGVPVVRGNDAGLAPCIGMDGRGGPDRSGPISYVLLDGTSAIVVHDGPAGLCTGAIGHVIDR